jgi:hypothetical protein
LDQGLKYQEDWDIFGPETQRQFSDWIIKNQKSNQPYGLQFCDPQAAMLFKLAWA